MGKNPNNRSISGSFISLLGSQAFCDQLQVYGSMTTCKDNFYNIHTWIFLNNIILACLCSSQSLFFSSIKVTVPKKNPFRVITWHYNCHDHHHFQRKITMIIEKSTLFTVIITIMEKESCSVSPFNSLFNLIYFTTGKASNGITLLKLLPLSFWSDVYIFSR